MFSALLWVFSYSSPIHSRIFRTFIIITHVIINIISSSPSSLVITHNLYYFELQIIIRKSETKNPHFPRDISRLCHRAHLRSKNLVEMEIVGVAVLTQSC